MGYPVTTITQQAFFGYGGILNGVTKINLPSSLRTIGSLAFGYCNGLKEIIVPNGVTNIDNWAFGMCSNLTNVVIPNSVLSVSYSLCYGNNNLRHITLSTNITWFDQRVLCYCILKELTLPPRLTYIGQYFNEYGNYEALVIPPLVSFIGTYAFAYNSSLTNVRFTGSIPPTADPDIFQSDTALSKIMVPSASLSAYKASLTQYSNKVFGY